MPRIPVESWTSRTCVIGGREVLAFGGCSYLGLAHHPAVQKAMVEGARRWGLTTTASRETTGNTLAHEGLEREVAAFFGFESAILTTEGYTANLALGQALAGTYPHMLLDATSHSSVVHSARAHGFHVAFYEHLNAADAVAKARDRAGEGVVVMADGVFAADGGVTPARAIYDGLPTERSLLVIDDCHGFCTLGERGRGVLELQGVPRDERVVLTTTLGKGLGCYGGAICGPRWLFDAVRAKSSVYRGTTPCPPPMIEAAREALRVIDREPVLLERLRRNVLHARRVLGRFAPPPTHPLVPIFTFSWEPFDDMKRAERELLEAGFLIPLIDYPGGPTPWYFRMTVSAAHEPADIDAVGAAVARAAR